VVYLFRVVIFVKKGKFFRNKIHGKTFFTKFANRIADTFFPFPLCSQDDIFKFQIKKSILVLYLIKSSIFTPLLKTF